MHGRAGGQLATLMAAVSPMALGMGVLLLVLAFVGLRLRQGEAASLPAAVAFYGGTVGMAVLVGVGLL